MVLDAAMHRKGDAVVQSENILSKVFYPLFQERGIHGIERERRERKNFSTKFALLLQKNSLITLLLAKYAMFSH